MKTHTILALLLAFFCCGAPAAAVMTPESQWKNLAIATGLTTPLTPTEESCYANLRSCYATLTTNETPTLYFTTRVYVHIAEEVATGKADALMLPAQSTRNYDVTFVTSAEQAIIKKAANFAVKEMMSGTTSQPLLTIWKNFALAAGLTTPLTPAERACYQNLGSCYRDLSPNETATLYFSTRVYFHFAEQVVNGNVDALFLPRNLTNSYDGKFVTSNEKMIIHNAQDLAIKALLPTVP